MAWTTLLGWTLMAFSLIFCYCTIHFGRKLELVPMNPADRDPAAPKKLVHALQTQGAVFFLVLALGAGGYGLHLVLSQPSPSPATAGAPPASPTGVAEAQKAFDEAKAKSDEALRLALSRAEQEAKDRTALEEKQAAAKADAEKMERARKALLASGTLPQPTTAPAVASAPSPTAASSDPAATLSASTERIKALADKAEAEARLAKALADKVEAEVRLTEAEAAKCAAEKLALNPGGKVSRPASTASAVATPPTSSAAPNPSTTTAIPGGLNGEFYVGRVNRRLGPGDPYDFKVGVNPMEPTNEARGDFYPDSLTLSHPELPTSVTATTNGRNGADFFSNDLKGVTQPLGHSDELVFISKAEVEKQRDLRHVVSRNFVVMGGPAGSLKSLELKTVKDGVVQP